MSLFRCGIATLNFSMGFNIIAELFWAAFFQMSGNIMGCHRHPVLFWVQLGYFNFCENKTRCHNIPTDFWKLCPIQLSGPPQKSKNSGHLWLAYTELQVGFDMLYMDMSMLWHHELSKRITGSCWLKVPYILIKVSRWALKFRNPKP